MAATTPPCKYVLLVDDNFAAGELTSLVLAADGFRVAVARNGAEALERLRSPERPRVILLDLDMPVMDGLSFCRELSPEDRAAIPIVVLSGLPDAADHAAALGAAACLSKPVDTLTLLATLRECCAAAPSLAAR